MTLGLLDTWGESGWYGTNAWTTKRHNLKKIGPSLASIRPGEYMKGHAGYLKAMEALFIGLGIGVVFIYRDIRDVIVSQAYHVTSDNKALRHPNKALYKQMGSFEDVLCAVIAGAGEFPGIFERWETYEPWLESPWVLPIKFEQMLRYPKASAERFLQYALDVAESDMEIVMVDPGLRGMITDNMVDLMQMGSVTKRKGEARGWQEEFTPRVIECFEEHNDDWLIRNGYEKDKEWLSQTAM